MLKNVHIALNKVIFYWNRKIFFELPAFGPCFTADRLMFSVFCFYTTSSFQTAEWLMCIYMQEKMSVLWCKIWVMDVGWGRAKERYIPALAYCYCKASRWLLGITSPFNERMAVDSPHNKCTDEKFNSGEFRSRARSWGSVPPSLLMWLPGIHLSFLRCRKEIELGTVACEAVP